MTNQDDLIINFDKFPKIDDNSTKEEIYKALDWCIEAAEILHQKKENYLTLKAGLRK